MADNTSHLPRTRKSRECDDPKKVGQWKIGRTIGTGTSGRVRLARHGVTGQMAAVKIVSKVSFNSAASQLHAATQDAEHILLSLEREIVTMKLIDHPNVMRLYDVFETSTQIYLVLEYVQGGELFDYLSERHILPVSEAMRYFQQIIHAVDYCHRFKIAHRDLKPENILLDEKKNIKIADFGMAAWLGNTSVNNGLLQTSCGSPHYAAPEIIKGENYNGAAVDVWSCGVVLYLLLVGVLPFDDDNLQNLLQKIVDGRYHLPPALPSAAQDLVVKMLNPDPAKRITIAAVLEHSFFYHFPTENPMKFIPSFDGAVSPIEDIDEHLFSNIVTLWHGTPEDELRESLMTQEPTTQKGVYLLLVDHRNKQEERQREIENLMGSKRVQKAPKSRDKKPLYLSQCEGPSVRNIPARVAPPTPRRARGGTFNKETSSSPLSGSSYPVTPATKPLTVPTNIKDGELQTFLQQVADQLNTIRTPAQPTFQVYSPPLSPLDGVPSAIDDMLTNLDSLGAELGRIDTRPLSLRKPKSEDKKKPVRADDKENIRPPVDGDGFVVVDKTLDIVRNKSKGHAFANKSLLPTPSAPPQTPGSRTPSKLRKKLFGGNHLPVSPAVSDGSASFATGSSATTPGRRSTWFGNVGSVFKNIKPSTFSLLSMHGPQTTRNECRRLLMGMNVRVTLLDEGLGSLKCRLDCGLQDPIGTIVHLKELRFRVEIEPFPDELAGSEYQVIVTLVWEKGSGESFREVWKRLRRDWRLDISGSETPKEPRSALLGQASGLVHTNP